MSNRILWILLLVWVTWFWYLFYIIFFVTYTWTLEINSNVENFSVKLYAKKIAKTYNYQCKTKTCSINEISPFDYNVTFSSPTYKDIITELSVKWRKINSLNANFVFDTKLNFVEEKSENTKISTGELNQNEINTQIDELKLKKWAYFFINIESLWYFYFMENKNELDFYNSLNWKETKLATFPKISNNEIWIYEVFWAKNKILISLWENKYLYNLESLRIHTFKLKPKLKYIKTWESKWSYLIVSDIWVYTYNESDNIPKYFYLFKDFVYSSWTYIWVIYRDETDKFNNFSLTNNEKNLIIKYNPQDLKRRVIIETPIDIDKIVLAWNDIFFYDKTDRKYKLENY